MANNCTEVRRKFWEPWMLLPLMYVVILGGAAFVGFVKFMAWWRIAFGSCHP